MHIVQDRAGFVEFHRYLVGSQIVVLENDSEEDVLRVGTYQLKLREGNKLLLHHAFYAPGVRCSLVSYVSLVRLGFTFGFHPDGLDLFYNGNLFGQATLKEDFIILDLDDNYNNISFAYVSYLDSNSQSVKWDARLGHVG